MGGNTRAIDRATGQVKLFDGVPALAEKIDLRVFDPDKLGFDFTAALLAIGRLFKRKYRRSLWRDDRIEELFVDGTVFNGASEILFADLVPLEEFLVHKPILGDIDVTVPHEALPDLFELLASLEGKQLVSGVTYVGQNKHVRSGHQINALFAWEMPPGRRFVQVDFEGVNYVGGRPDAFSKFAHSSSWDDIKAGIKGVAHKYWMTNLVRALSSVPDALVLTEKSPLPPSPVRIRQTQGVPRTHAFSVDRGLREKLKLVRLPNGRPFTQNGKQVYREESTGTSTYVTDLSQIFRWMFGKRPSPRGLKSMGSFLGLLDLTETFLSRTSVISAYRYLVTENLYGWGAQKLDRDSSLVDEETKEAILTALKRKFPYLKDLDEEVKLASTSFYGTY